MTTHGNWFKEKKTQKKNRKRTLKKKNNINRSFLPQFELFDAGPGRAINQRTRPVDVSLAFLQIPPEKLLNTCATTIKIN